MYHDNVMTYHIGVISSLIPHEFSVQPHGVEARNADRLDSTWLRIELTFQLFPHGLKYI